MFPIKCEDKFQKNVEFFAFEFGDTNYETTPTYLLLHYFFNFLKPLCKY